MHLIVALVLLPTGEYSRGTSKRSSVVNCTTHHFFLNPRKTEADQFALAVVGTRNATTYGRQVTERIVADLAKGQVTVVSGLARRIVESGQGVLITEYPLGVQPDGGNFPARNRTVNFSRRCA